MYKSKMAGFCFLLVDPVLLLSGDWVLLGDEAL